MLSCYNYRDDGYLVRNKGNEKVVCWNGKYDAMGNRQEVNVILRKKKGKECGVNGWGKTFYNESLWSTGRYAEQNGDSLTVKSCVGSYVTHIIDKKVTYYDKSCGAIKIDRTDNSRSMDSDFGLGSNLGTGECRISP